MAVANSTLYNLHSTLFVEVFLEGLEFVLLQYAPLPPRFNESQTVAHELNKGCRDAEQANPKTLVLETRVNEDDGAI